MENGFSVEYAAFNAALDRLFRALEAWPGEQAPDVAPAPDQPKNTSAYVSSDAGQGDASGGEARISVVGESQPKFVSETVGKPNEANTTVDILKVKPYSRWQGILNFLPVLFEAKAPDLSGYSEAWRKRIRALRAWL